MSSSVRKKWSCLKPKQTVSTVCYKINLSWYPVSLKLASYKWEYWRLIAYSVYQKLWILISIKVI